MAISLFDLFKIGIGPSSSHTVGPMRAARLFIGKLEKQHAFDRLARIQCDLYGSLAATGKGHGTDKAVLLGLLGQEPDRVSVDAIPDMLARLRREKRLPLPNGGSIDFIEKTDIKFHRRQTLPQHSNGMIFTAFAAEDEILATGTYYSVGGGFVVSNGVVADKTQQQRIAPDESILPFAFGSSAELLSLCEKHQLSIAALMRRNEQHWRSDEEIDAGLRMIWDAMQECVVRGCRSTGILPGGYKVRRRAPALYESLVSHPEAALRDPLQVLDWVNLYAMAVNEENAAGGRVVTAPTNGAAGIIPAVLHYYTRFVHGSDERGVFDFLLTAAAIGLLYKKNASISGAEVGCQGEVGVACSMAAGALCAVLGGTPQQVENAAEIGMEHHLGLTCDPVGGLVQIPCIERNAIAAVKAINSARMALRGNGMHFVSLDQVIKTMRDTGADMMTKYKETARGGLAVNIIEC